MDFSELFKLSGLLGRFSPDGKCLVAAGIGLGSSRWGGLRAARCRSRGGKRGERLCRTATGLQGAERVGRSVRSVVTARAAVSTALSYRHLKG